MFFRDPGPSSVAIFLVAINSILNISSASRVDTFQKCLAHRSIPSSLWVTPKTNSTHYAFLNQPWNTRKSPVTPLGYFLPKTTPHVQHAVQCGVLSNLKFIPNSGGHSYESLSWGDNSSAIMDFREMTRISLLPPKNWETSNTPMASVQPGALLGHVAADLWTLGKVAIPMGNCLTVGMGGHAIGGGVGFFTRTYGLTTDNLVEVEMVDAAGVAVRANRYQNPDLFWGMRGSGAGYIGMVTNVKIKTFRAAEAKFTFVKTAYKLKDWVKVYVAYQNWLEWVGVNEPGITSTLFIINEDWIPQHAISPRKQGGIILDLLYIYDPSLHQRNCNSTFLSKMEEIFPPGFDRVVTFPTYPEVTYATAYAPVKLPPNQSTAVPRSWPAHNWPNSAPALPEQEILKQFRMMRKEYAAPRYYYAKSLFVKRHLSLEEIERVGKVLPSIPLNSCWLTITSEAGNIAQHSKTEAAYVHRDSFVNFAVNVEVLEGEGGSAEEGMSWLREYWDALQSFDGGETYQNYPDLEVKDYLERHYGSNLKRLINLKRDWDPRNYFTNPLSIPVSQL